jgi:ATP-dependent DNA helicase DinG
MSTSTDPADAAATAGDPALATVDREALSEPVGGSTALPPVERMVETLVSLTGRLDNGGEHRHGQQEMARAVHEAMAGRFHLIARAGTGTGKSLAYLVPVALSKRTTVIATATKALQDQLAGKDLPFLQRHLGISWAVLKGRANYVCVQRLSEVAADRQLALTGLDSSRIDDEVDAIVEWAATTRTGDRAELAVEPSAAAWNTVSVGSEECPGATKCPSGDDCFAEAAKAKAAASDIIVVNTHLYGIHLASDGILPDHDIVVIDEAHQLEDIISATAGVELSSGRFGDVARNARGIIAGDNVADAIEDAGRALDDALEAAGDGRIEVRDDGDVQRSITAGREAANELLAALRAVPSDAGLDVTTRKERAQQSATTLIADIDRAAEVTDDDVAYVAGPPGRRSLRIAPIDVGSTLRATLWEKPTAILTSATVPDVLPDQLGLGPDQYRFVDVGSPFDYDHAALLYCAVDLPEPRDPAFAEASVVELERLIVAAGGRTLALFTSWKAMTAAVETLRPRLPWTVLAQGELPKPALLEAFKSEADSCLFATMSFWQGVDIPGAALSLVVIDKIPFPRPDDPLLQARRERAGAAAFGRVDLPRAAMMLAQGTGRLIRSAEDKGVVAVLDRRLATSKSYRWQLIGALPPYRRTRDRAEVEAFLRRLRDA